MGIIYRGGQFWKAITAAPPIKDMDLVKSILSAEQVRLFELMKPDEQQHCVEVAKRLLEKQHHHPDLLAAALLHDVGKTVYPLHLWERVWLVLGNAFFPGKASQWRQVSDPGILEKNHWRRVFVIHQNHAVWGANLAQKAGANPVCVRLIERHQQVITMDTVSLEDQLLSYLQEADNLS